MVKDAQRRVLMCLNSECESDFKHINTQISHNSQLDVQMILLHKAV